MTAAGDVVAAFFSMIRDAFCPRFGVDCADPTTTSGAPLAGFDLPEPIPVAPCNRNSTPSRLRVTFPSSLSARETACWSENSVSDTEGGGGFAAAACGGTAMSEMDKHESEKKSVLR